MRKYIILILIIIQVSLIIILSIYNTIFNTVYLYKTSENKTLLLLRPMYENGKLYRAYFKNDSLIKIKDVNYLFYKNSEVVFHDNGIINYGYVSKFDYQSYYQNLVLSGSIHLYDDGLLHRARLGTDEIIQIKNNYIPFKDGNELYFSKEKKIIECWTTEKEIHLSSSLYSFIIVKNESENIEWLIIEFYENGNIKLLDLVGYTLIEKNKKIDKLTGKKISFDEEENIKEIK